MCEIAYQESNNVVDPVKEYILKLEQDEIIASFIMVNVMVEKFEARSENDKTLMIETIGEDKYYYMENSMYNLSSKVYEQAKLVMG